MSGLNEPFARTIQKAMARDPAERFQSVDEMLRSLSPDDHSSYLPPPASLSMIGDRAASKRARQTVPNAIILDDEMDTSIPVASLIDTAKDSDSQPFERPGIPTIPAELGSKLNEFGIWWQRPKVPLVGKDSVSLGRRTFLVWLVCALIVVLASYVTDQLPNKVIFMIATLPIVGAIVTWLFLQLLPRSSKIGWTIASRFLSNVIAILVVQIYLREVPDVMPFFRLDDLIGFALFAGLLIDWRCFITADRYPRVGAARTLLAVSIFYVGLASHGGAAFPATALICGVVISIQLFAPQYQIRDDYRPKPKGGDQADDKVGNRKSGWDKLKTKAVEEVSSMVEGMV